MAVTETAISTLGQRVAQQYRDLRMARGMTQGDVAAAIGMGQSAVAKVEQRAIGTRDDPLRLAMLEQMAWALDAELVIELRPR